MPKSRDANARPVDAAPMPLERPELTPERIIDEEGRETFPASDASATTVTQGARAVPPQRLMEDDAPVAVPDAVLLAARFADRVAARLAVETLVRDAPLDRHRAELRDEGKAVLVTVQATPADAERLRAMLERCGGALGAPPQGP